MVPVLGIKEKNTDFDAMYILADNKEDFKRVSEGNKPKAIDFSAESGDFPTKNIDQRFVISDTRRGQKRELKNMQKHYNKDKAEKWLKNEKVDNVPVINNEPPKLVIHIKEEKEEKKVRFAISPDTTQQIISPNIDSIISRMKKKDNSEEMKEVINILKEILTTQRDIIINES